MSESDITPKTRTTLQERVALGTEYREDFEFELYGEETTAVIKPLDDDVYLPILSSIAEILGVDAENPEEKMEEVEDAKEAEGGEIDPSQMDEDFVAELQRAAVLGLVGGYTEDGEYVDFDAEECKQLVSGMKGGASVELGSRVLDLSGNVDDAEKFR